MCGRPRTRAASSMSCTTTCVGTLCVELLTRRFVVCTGRPRAAAQVPTSAMRDLMPAKSASSSAFVTDPSETCRGHAALDVPQTVCCQSFSNARVIFASISLIVFSMSLAPLSPGQYRNVLARLS